MVSLRSHLARRVIWLTLLGLPLLARAQTNSLLAGWLNSQTNIQTWSADLVQTRKLKSLTQPLTATGHVWFAAPNRFHWELGNPAQTIAVRDADKLFIIYPKLKRAESYSLIEAGQWRDTLALLDAGFPRNQAELDKQFNVLSEIITTGEGCEITLQPKSVSARRMMPQIKIGFSAKDFLLLSTELQFADGSTLRNDFTNTVMNPKLDDVLFAPKLGADFKIVEPLRK